MRFWKVWADRLTLLSAHEGQRIGAVVRASNEADALSLAGVKRGRATDIGPGASGRPGVVTTYSMHGGKVRWDR